MRFGWPAPALLVLFKLLRLGFAALSRGFGFVVEIAEGAEIVLGMVVAGAVMIDLEILFIGTPLSVGLYRGALVAVPFEDFLSQLSPIRWEPATAIGSRPSHVTP